MQEPLYSLLNGPEAEVNANALLRGALPIPEELEHHTKSFLKQCRCHHGFCPQKIKVTMDNHHYFWSQSNENKGSEPHRLHNGHFKVGCQSLVLLYCDATFCNLPLMTGMVPEQWKHLMNFAIEKKLGDFWLSKMRTIQIMNSEFQANNKLLGRLAMKFAERHKLIPAGQCGSRKQHQAIDLALSKQLVWDLLILQHRAAGWISNDAKSCRFDRVMHSIAIILLLRFGLLWKALMMMFETLATATHRVHTGFGNSDVGFFPPSDKSFQGCGQGNGAGPPIWVAVSLILILMIEAAGFVFEYLTAISHELITAQCFSFVDDTKLVEAAKSVDQTGESILPVIQQMAALWSGGIRATGGAINPDKCFWWLLDFEWDSREGRWSFWRFDKQRKKITTKKRSIESLNGNLQFKVQSWQGGTASKESSLMIKIYGLKGTLEPLKMLDPSDAQRTLGVMMSPLENHAAQFKFVTDKACEWAETVRVGYLKCYDVFPLIRTTTLKSLEYPSALSTLSYSKWSLVMSPVLQVCLPKAGVCRSFPRTMVFAPLKAGSRLRHPSPIRYPDVPSLGNAPLPPSKRYPNS